MYDAATMSALSQARLFPFRAAHDAGRLVKSPVGQRGTMPDVTVVRTNADTLRGVDAALERAKALAARSTAMPRV